MYVIRWPRQKNLLSPIPYRIISSEHFAASSSFLRVSTFARAMARNEVDRTPTNSALYNAPVDLNTRTNYRVVKMTNL